MSFKDKVVLITGAQEGIGRSIVERFAKKGAAVAINWLDDKSKAEGIAGLARDLGAQTFLVQGDVSVVSDARRLVSETITELGSIEILVNNAGIFPRVPLLTMEEDDWDQVIDVNLKGTFFCAQAALKDMIKSKLPGKIVNLSSQAIRGYAPDSAHYTASKMGVIGLTRAIALDVAKHGIRVNCVAPGLTDTAQPRYGNTEEELFELVKSVPLGRLIQPEEVADLVLFLCSDETKMITGQTYHVNGGTYSPG